MSSSAECACSPLRLPVEEAERGVGEPAHLGQRPLVVNADEEVRGRGVLEGRVHRLSNPAHTAASHQGRHHVTYRTNRMLCSLETRNDFK